MTNQLRNTPDSCCRQSDGGRPANAPDQKVSTRIGTARSPAGRGRKTAPILPAGRPGRNCAGPRSPSVPSENTHAHRQGGRFNLISYGQTSPG